MTATTVSRPIFARCFNRLSWLMEQTPQSTGAGCSPRRAAAWSRSGPATVGVGVAEELPLGDGACDTAVASLVLCTVTDPPRALAELQRVLRPGGQLLFLEHVRSDRPGKARVQTCGRGRRGMKDTL